MRIQKIRVTGIVFKDKKFLLLHRIPNPFDVWEFPSGTAEWGEDPKKAITREVKEETGLEIIEKGLLAVSSCEYEKDDDKIHEIVIAYLFEAKNVEVKLSKEHSEFKWVSLEEMKKIPNLALSVKCIWDSMEKEMWENI